MLKTGSQNCPQSQANEPGNEATIELKCCLLTKTWKGWVSGHLEMSKQKWVLHLLYCSSKLRVRLQEWPTSSALRGIKIDYELTWSAWASPTPCWPVSLR